MKTRWNISLITVILALAVLSVYNFNDREYDWDMPGYLSSLYVSYGIDDAAKIHQLTYGEIKKESSAKEYDKITGKDIPSHATYHFARNPKAFAEQIPYYQVKVGYNWCIKALHLIGFSGPMSILLVSINSFFVSGILLFFCLKFLFPKHALPVGLGSIVMMAFPYFHYMATIASPDMLGMVFLLLFLLLVLKRSRSHIIFLSLLLLVFCRPDYLVFAFSYLAALGLYSLIKKKKFRFDLLVHGIILFLMYFSVVKYYQYPGWSDVFYDSFIKRRFSISSEPISLSFTDYKTVILENIINFKKITLAAVLMVSAIFYFTKNIFVRLLGLMIFANIFLKFLIFPAPGEVRFFIGFLLLLFIWMLYAIVNDKRQMQKI